MVKNDTGGISVSLPGRPNLPLQFHPPNSTIPVTCLPIFQHSIIPLLQQIKLVDNGIPGKTMKLRIQNPPPNLGIKTEISRLLSIPDHQGY
jgi:hypothetical protein